MIDVKVNYHQDIRRFILDAPLLDRLWSHITNIFKLSNHQTNLKLLYRDPEKDWIRIASDKDLEAAFELFKPKKLLRLILVEDESKDEREMCDEFNLEKNKSQISLLVEEVVKSEDFERIVQGVLPSIVHIVKNQGEMINVDEDPNLQQNFDYAAIISKYKNNCNEEGEYLKKHEYNAVSPQTMNTFRSKFSQLLSREHASEFESSLREKEMKQEEESFFIVDSPVDTGVSSDQEIVKKLREMGYKDNRRITLALKIYPNNIEQIVDYLNRIKN